MPRIFVIDWLLVPVFLSVLYSGLGLHLAGHAGDHGVWHDWAAVHVVLGTAMLGLVGMHVRAHRSWYKGLFAGRPGRRNRVTVLLSGLFAAAVVSGAWLLGVDGANSDAGLIHYIVGVAMSAAALWHLAGRMKILIRSLKKRQ